MKQQIMQQKGKKQNLQVQKKRRVGAGIFFDAKAQKVTCRLALSKGRSWKFYEDVSLDDKGYSTELFEKLDKLDVNFINISAPNIPMEIFKLQEIPGMEVQLYK